MAPVQSTFSQVWEDFCKLCCLATPVLGQFLIQEINTSVCSVHSDTKLHILVLYPRVQKDCLAFSSLLPNDVCELCVRGVNYLGSQMDWLLRKEEVCIILREQEGSPGNTKPCNLQVVLKASGTKIPLTPGKAQVQTCSLNMQFFRESFIHEDNLIVSMLIRDKHFSQYSKKKLSFNCLYGDTILIEVKNI